MKKILAFCVIVLIFGIAGVANAALIDRGGGLIYDSDQDITWLQSASHSETGENPFYWGDAVAWADELVYGGYDDWRLPSTPGNNTGAVNEGEMGYLYYEYGISASNPGLFFTGVLTCQYWTGTENTDTFQGAWYFVFDEITFSGEPQITYEGYQGLSQQNLNGTITAWAVRDGDVATVPIPSAVWLLGFGLIGLAGVRARAKRN